MEEKKFAGNTVGDIGFNRDFKILVLTIMKKVKERNILGIFRKVSKLQIEGVASADTLLVEGDIMVLYGHNEDIQDLLKD